MQKKILIVDKADPVLAEKLERAGFLCETILDISYQQFIDKPDHYLGLIIRSKFLLDQKSISSKPHLKFIVRLGAGMESIDLQFAKNQGITCLSTPEGNAPAVAEHCLALLLSNLRHINEANQEVRNGFWLREKNKGKEIHSLVFGIIGFGNTGQAFTKLLKFFNPEILVYDKFKSGFSQEGIQEVSLDDLLAKCDVLSIHINYIEENHHFLNHHFFEKVKKPILLINSSRGAVLNTQDLLQAIKNQKVAHACLDVLEYENVNLQIPSKDKWDQTMMQLSECKQVTLTPHIAGQTPESERRHAEFAFQKIINLTQNIENLS